MVYEFLKEQFKNFPNTLGPITINYLLYIACKSSKTPLLLPSVHAFWKRTVSTYLKNNWLLLVKIWTNQSLKQDKDPTYLVEPFLEVGPWSRIVYLKVECFYNSNFDKCYKSTIICFCIWLNNAFFKPFSSFCDSQMANQCAIKMVYLRFPLCGNFNIYMLTHHYYLTFTHDRTIHVTGIIDRGPFRISFENFRYFHFFSLNSFIL